MLVGIVVCRNERVSSCGKIHLLVIARALFRGQVPSCRGSLLELFSFGYILFLLGGFGPLGGRRYFTQALRESCYPFLVKPFQLCEDI